jgi:hypothetical protein
VHATLADRDKIAGDDYVEILLDTFNDHRQALVFGVNPLGVQSDGILNEGNRSGVTGFGATVRDSVDLSADFVFHSKGRVTADGYEVEIRIPFKSIRYQPRDPQDWGINVVRQVQHSGHQDTWTPARRAAASFLGQSGTLVGLSDLRRGLVLDLNPEATGAADGAAGPGGWDYTATGPRLGGNARWGITNNLTLTGTAKLGRARRSRAGPGTCSCSAAGSTPTSRRAGRLTTASCTSTQAGCCGAAGASPPACSSSRSGTTRRCTPATHYSTRRAA